MTPEERQLITGLFDRMRNFDLGGKDRDAEAIISQLIRANPDAPYMLVQSVLVQEQALEAANNRVLDLEERVRSLEDGAPTRAQTSGSFLGGFGSGRPASSAEARGSVPQVGARATPSTYDSRSAWGQNPSQPPSPQAPAASGGFMRSALATAAGVAGGVLVADSIRNMLGGAHASPSTTSTPGQETQQQDAQYVDERDNDPGNYDANDPGYDAGDLGGDIEL
jgi:hypothetical protein